MKIKITNGILNLIPVVTLKSGAVVLKISSSAGTRLGIKAYSDGYFATPLDGKHADKGMRDLRPLTSAELTEYRAWRDVFAADYNRRNA